MRLSLKTVKLQRYFAAGSSAIRKIWGDADSPVQWLHD